MAERKGGRPRAVGPRGKQISVILDPDALERIDVVRGPMTRQAWIRLVIDRTLGSHPMFQSPSLRRLIHELPALGDEMDICRHPPEYLHKGICGRCSAILDEPDWRRLSQGQ